MRTLLGALAFTLLISAPGTPQTPGPKPAVPPLTAEDVLAKYLEAIGGARLHKVKSIVKKSECTRGDTRSQTVTYRSAPDLFATVTTSSNGDKQAVGFDGTTLWVLPSKPLDGQEAILDGYLEGAPIATEFHIRRYRKVKLLGTKNVGDRSTYVVELNHAEAERHTYYIDTQTFLLLRLDSTERYKLGPEPSWQKDIRGSYLVRSTTYYSDWRRVQSVMLPFESRQVTASNGQDDHGDTYWQWESITRVIEYQIDTPVDVGVFAPPLSSVKRTVKK
jgi:hypothetical protein